MKLKWRERFTIFTGVVIIAFAVLPGLANAMNFELGEDTSIDCDVTVTYGAGWRVSDRDDDLRYPNVDVNVDDPNENFDQWSMINNKLTLFADIDIQHKNMGIFVRPKVFYDHVYMSDNDNNSPSTNNVQATPGLNYDTDEWVDDVEDIHGRDAEILDLFAYASFQLGGRIMELRVGKQVIAWGESLLLAGGISSAQAPVDAAAAVAVGTEVKEIYLPTESVYLQVELTEACALLGYYQWKWEKTKLMEGGTFFSQFDVYDEIKTSMMLGPILPPPYTLPTIDRVSDDEAGDSGQFGVALTYMLPWLEATEIGLYYINYHDKNPTLDLDLGYLVGGSSPPTYRIAYTEDIKLYGISFSSVIGDANVSGEFSYRQDMGLHALDPAIKGNYWQAQTSMLYLLTVPFCDSLTLLGEVACGREIGLEDDKFAWTYALRPTLSWYAVLPDLDMSLTLAYADAPTGDDTGRTKPHLAREGAAAGSIGVDFTYKFRYKAGLTYENRFNSKRNYASDRDTIALKLSCTF